MTSPGVSPSFPFAILSPFSTVNGIIPDTITLHSTGPIKSLPPELLSTIFLWCLPEPDDPWFDADSCIYGSPFEVDNKRLYPPLIPLIISHVCRVWNDVALDTSGLWANIVVHNELRIMDSQMAAKWMSRSNGHPLHLHWAQDDHTYSWVISMVQSCPNRWRRMHLIAKDSGILSHTARSLRHQMFESLVSLRLDTYCEDFAAVGSNFLDVCPNLRNLSIHPSTPILRLHNLDLRHEQVTHLDVQQLVPVGAAMFILNSCPSLTSMALVLGSSYAYSEFSSHMDPAGRKLRSTARAPSLTALSLTARPRSIDEVDFARFWQDATIPHLTYLDLWCPAHYIASDVFHASLSRSSCHLRSFALTVSEGTLGAGPSLSAVHFLGHPSVADSLEVLDLWDTTRRGYGSSYPRLEDSLLDFLTLCSFNTKLLRLRELSLSVEVTSEDGLSKLANALESRFSPSPALLRDNDDTSLQNAKLRLRSRRTPNFERLCSLQKAGYGLEFQVEREGY